MSYYYLIALDHARQMARVWVEYEHSSIAPLPSGTWLILSAPRFEPLLVQGAQPLSEELAEATVVTANLDALVDGLKSSLLHDEPNPSSRFKTTVARRGQIQLLSPPNWRDDDEELRKRLQRLNAN